MRESVWVLNASPPEQGKAQGEGVSGCTLYYDLATIVAKG